MGEVLLVILGPTVVFGLFALLAMRFGAESRPYFDERPVVDDRPNWFPIAGAGGLRDDQDEDDDVRIGGPPDAEPAPAAVTPAPPQPRPARAAAASATSAATSPAGV
jgi:hypothetical protein